MKRISQNEIANSVGVSDAFISMLISGKKRPSWKKAKMLAAFTGTKPELWLDGSPEEIKAALAGENTCACSSE